MIAVSSIPCTVIVVHWATDSLRWLQGESALDLSLSYVFGVVNLYEISFVWAYSWCFPRFADARDLLSRLQTVNWQVLTLIGLTRDCIVVVNEAFHQLHQRCIPTRGIPPERER